MHRPMRVIHEDGTRVYQYRQQPDGLFLACPVYVMRKTAIYAQDQWLLALLLPPQLSLEQWNEVFGSFVMYPAEGEWAPCEPIVIDRGQEPSVADTWIVINAIRQQRRVSAAEWDAETAEALERRDNAPYNRILDQLKDKTPVGYGIPGQKENVSFPSLSRTGDESGSTSEHAGSV
jgi:hypothetical protein